MNIEIKQMTLIDLESVKNILSIEFDDFWSYSVLKEELESENSKYLVAKFRKYNCWFCWNKNYF